MDLEFALVLDRKIFSLLCSYRLDMSQSEKEALIAAVCASNHSIQSLLSISSGWGVSNADLAAQKCIFRMWDKAKPIVLAALWDEDEKMAHAAKRILNSIEYQARQVPPLTEEELTRLDGECRHYLRRGPAAKRRMAVNMLCFLSAERITAEPIKHILDLIGDPKPFWAARRHEYIDAILEVLGFRHAFLEFSQYQDKREDFATQLDRALLVLVQLYSISQDTNAKESNGYSKSQAEDMFKKLTTGSHPPWSKTYLEETEALLFPLALLKLSHTTHGAFVPDILAFQKILSGSETDPEVFRSGRAQFLRFLDFARAEGIEEAKITLLMERYSSHFTWAMNSLARDSKQMKLDEGAFRKRIRRPLSPPNGGMHQELRRCSG